MVGSCASVKSKGASQVVQNQSFGCLRRYLAPGSSQLPCSVS